jgi:DNA-binding NtrC family response regulator
MEIKADNRKRILFVNDDADTTAVIKTDLTLQGFEVETFIDPKSALQHLFYYYRSRILKLACKICCYWMY